MKFKFPKDTKKVSVSIRLDETINNKIRKLAEIHNCVQQDIFTVIIEEAIEEYEEKFGVLEERKNHPHYMDPKPKTEPEAVTIQDPIFDIKTEKATVTEIPIEPEKKWSRNYDSCIKCHSTERKYLAKGYCSRCYFQQQGEDTEELQYTCENPQCDTPKMKFKRLEMAERLGKYYCSPECASMVSKGISNKFMGS